MCCFLESTFFCYIMMAKEYVEDTSGEGEQEWILNRARWRVGVGEIAVRVGCKSGPPPFTGINLDQLDWIMLSWIKTSISSDLSYIFTPYQFSWYTSWNHFRVSSWVIWNLRFSQKRIARGLIVQTVQGTTMLTRNKLMCFRSAQCDCCWRRNVIYLSFCIAFKMVDIFQSYRSKNHSLVIIKSSSSASKNCFLACQRSIFIFFLPDQLVDILLSVLILVSQAFHTV